MKFDEIEIMIHDAAVNEQLRGTSTTQNRDVLKAVELVNKELQTIKGNVVITDVTNSFEAKTKWDEEVSFK